MPIDDYTTSIINGVVGKLFLTLYSLEVIVRPQYTQKGANKKDGMVDFYKNTNSFERSYCSYMVAPSFINVRYWKGNFIPIMDKDKAYPKILSSRFKGEV